MVQRCCVPFCETKVGDPDINGVKVRFHRMPMVPERFQQWRAKITNHGQYKPEPELTVNSRICSKHFVKQDYLDNCHNKPVTGNHILSKESIPTRFRWSSENCDVSAAIPFVRRVKPAPQNENQNQAQAHHYHLSHTHATNHSHFHHHPRTHNHNQNHHAAGAAVVAYISSNKANGKDDTISIIEHSAVEKQTQCSFEDERLKNEISRKNSIIQQLLERISQLEAEHKATTQILLKDSISSSGTTASVIRAVSPAAASIIKDNTRDHNHNNHNQDKRNNNNNNHDSSSYTNLNHSQNNPKRRKVQQPQPINEDDENIHYVLLSLSEKVVMHDNRSSPPGT